MSSEPHATGARSTTVLVVYGFLLAVAVVLGGGLATVYARTQATSAAFTRQAELKQLGQQLAAASDRLTDDVRKYAQFGDDRFLQSYWREVNETKTRDRVVAGLHDLHVLDEDLALLELAKRNSDALIATESKAMELTKAGRFDEARALLFSPRYDADKQLIMAPIAEFQTRIARRAQSEVDVATSDMSKGFGVLAIVSAAIVLASAVGFGIFRSRFAKPISALNHAARQLASGHVDVVVEVVRDDELGAVARSFNTMVDGMRQQIDVARRIAKGDLDAEVHVRSEHDVLGLSIRQMSSTLRSLLGEIASLTKAAREGALSTRGRPSAFEGLYRELVTGVNDTLDSVVSPVDEAIIVLERIADRDLSARMRGTYAGDHARMKTALNAAVGNLQSSMLQVASTAEQVSSAAGEIASASQLVASGAVEQARAIDQVSGRLDEMSSTAKRNADDTQAAHHLAISARDASGRGTDAMSRLASAMTRIKVSVEGTAAIIRDINDVAFQTNLLALNAAVEAARAGDSGRGFAVVAEEVRSLALRTKEAARKTEELIRESVNVASEGQDISRLAHGDFASIVVAIKEVTAIMEQIGQSGQQQSQGVQQINQNVVQMNHVTQANSASSEESASAAEELSGQAGELISLVQKFELGQSRGAANDTRPTSARRASGAHRKAG